MPARWLLRGATSIATVTALWMGGGAALAEDSADTDGEQDSTGRCALAQDGTAAADALIGTPVGDLIDAGPGADVVMVVGSADCTKGGPGADLIVGGNGRDRLNGGSGHDVIRARDGRRDIVRCGRGRDVAVVDPKDRVRGCERVKSAKSKRGTRGGGRNPDPGPSPEPDPPPGTDTTPPETSVDSGPEGTSADREASFTFSSTEADSTFECRIDFGSWTACTSSASYSSLSDGAHVFEVRATDAAGNMDTTPANRSFIVDAVAPETSIDGGPNGVIASRSGSFSFSSSDEGSSFECRLDAGAWGACTSPVSHSSLSDGDHVFEVRATDQAGNTDPTPASRRFTVDTASPQTSITSGPSGTITTDSASFGFSSSEEGSTFECRLDGGSYSSCSSPKSYSGLSDGAHTFDVRATDAAGNTDSSPASRSFTVDTTPEPVGCQVDLGRFLAPGCPVKFDDTAKTSDPMSLWGAIDCQTSSRATRPTSGGDPSPTAEGVSQGNTAYRSTKVLDGDDFWGERCELGRNDHGYNDPPGPTVLYYEGQRRITFISLRLPSNYPLSQNAWQVVMQMKQAQPSANGGGTPVLALNAYAGRWRLHQSKSVDYSSTTQEVWSAPAQTGEWTRFAFDITYSQDPAKGKINVYADLNGDGDSADGGERSSTISTYTLKRESSGGSQDGIDPGESIPSHLRAGIYHNSALECPASNGCAAEVDNVQVVKPQ